MEASSSLDRERWGYRHHSTAARLRGLTQPLAFSGSVEDGEFIFQRGVELRVYMQALGSRGVWAGRGSRRDATIVLPTFPYLLFVAIHHYSKSAR